MSTFKGLVIYRPDSKEFLNYFLVRDGLGFIDWSTSIEDSLIYDNPLEANSDGWLLSESLEISIELYRLYETKYL